MLSAGGMRADVVQLRAVRGMVPAAEGGVTPGERQQLERDRHRCCDNARWSATGTFVGCLRPRGRACARPAKVHAIDCDMDEDCVCDVTRVR